MVRRMVFPFVAVVGQELVKQALLIAAVNPKAGGVLLAGEKGTAKSTLVRGLVNVLGAVRLVELPLNATEDMVFGSIDIQKAVQHGVRAATPGLLAKADGQLLYMDEINLLRREIVSGILDVASTGQNKVERESISCCFDARFIMIGSMNPEEGNLAPQLLDRFGMVVTVQGERDASVRAEIVRQILAYERDPVAFCQQHQEDSERLQQTLTAAQQRLHRVELPEAMLELAAQYCCQAHSAGHRGELFLVEVARSIAALNERLFVLPDDVMTAAKLVLPHRLQPEPPTAEQSKPEEPSNQQPEQSEDNPEETQDEHYECPDHEEQSQAEQDNQSEQDHQQEQADGQAEASAEQTADIGGIPPIGKLDISTRDRQVRQGSGKRSLTRTDAKLGRYVRAEIRPDLITDLALDATLRAAAVYQRSRPRGNCALTIYRQDWRKKIREKRIGSTFLFVVDASGSMGARQRMAAVKGTVLALLQDAYQKRDQVGLIAFRRDHAEMLLPVTRSVDLAQKCLKHLPTGGKTPLAEGLVMTMEVMQALKRRDKDVQPVVVLVTDGRANSRNGSQPDAVTSALDVSRKLGATGVHSLVIDTEQDFIRLGIAGKIARNLGGAYYKLEELSAQKIIQIVNRLR